ncbi:signal transduction histidine kinase regulating citrate/malate metabolism [Parafrankia sp. EAN1pec]|uniref:sensor histidine kinase n=1 Tax=Parafrankia sp. (strain EAN1pec) TaxID=298653 RepID=UPI0000543067|nr:signal transduction histidine kinase regulating citrate/malate metabolism [Frankia sp. EAN1pec]
MTATPGGADDPSGGRGARLSRRSIAGQVLVLQVAVVVLLVVAAVAASVLQARRTAERQARDLAVAVAETFAHAPGMVAALSSSDPSASLQPLAEATRTRTGVDFLVVMNPVGIRYTHPDPTRIGQRFLGHTEPAVRGEVLTETYSGTLGPSVRAVVPVTTSDGKIAALVAAGITVENVSQTAGRQLPVLLVAGLAAVALAVGGTVLVNRRLRRQTRGLGPVEITRMYEHHDTVLHAVREGVLIVDDQARVLLANDEARRLLGLPSDSHGRPVAELGLDPAALDLLGSGRPAEDTVLLAGDRMLAVNQKPTVRDGKPLGSVATIRDTTELQALTGELDAVRGMADALRAQSHEAANQLHIVVTLMQLDRLDEAVEFATAGLAGSQQLADRMLTAVDEPVLAALLLGKTAQAAERGVELVVTDDTRFEVFDVEAAELVTVVGNLIDNAIEAAVAGEAPRRVTVSVRTEPDGLTVRVSDTGHGLDPTQVAAAFERGWTTKTSTSTGEAARGRGLGLALVRQVVRRHGGQIEVGRDGGAVFTVRIPRQHGSVDMSTAMTPAR